MVINLNIPQTWNDLSETQFKNIAYQLECYHTLIKDTPQALENYTTALYLQVCKELLRHNPWQSIRIALKEIQPKAYQTYSKFIYSGIDRTKFIPEIKINNTTYHSPDMRLRNSTISEFAFADTAYYKWRQTNQTMWLNVLCAALYREANTETSEVDTRKPFIKQAVDKRADAFLKLDHQTKLAIAYTYEGCRGHIANTFPLIFPKPIKTEGEEATPTKQKKYVSFGEIILDKIEGDPSKLETTNNVMLYDFLSIYNNDIKKLRKNPK